MQHFSVQIDDLGFVCDHVIQRTTTPSHHSLVKQDKCMLGSLQLGHS